MTNGESFFTSTLTKFTVDESNTWFSASNDSLYSYNYDRIICHRKQNECFVFHPDTLAISYLSLSYCQGDLIIPHHIINFNDCSLYNLYSRFVTFQCHLDKIVPRMFEGCLYLESIHIPEGVSIIQSDAFKNCVSLTSIYLPYSLLTISPSAFYNTGVKCIYGNINNIIEQINQANLPLNKCFIGNPITCHFHLKSFHFMANLFTLILLK